MGMTMFASAKPLSVVDRKATARTGSLTGLERAKLERVHQDELPPQPVETVEPVLAPETAATAPELPEPPKTVIVPAPRPAPVAASPVSIKSSAIPVATGKPGNAAHLYAGPGIMLKGEIVGCDTLRVEGVVDGNATARQLVICQGGRFLGTAQVEEAEIEGSLEGTLTVHGHLLLRSSGRIAGTLSYGQIEVERGGEIVGQVTAQGNPSLVKPPPAQLLSVSNERRAVTAMPVEGHEPVQAVPQPVAAAHAEPEPVKQEVRAPEPTAAQAAPQPVKAAPVAEAAAKARKSLFFGRS